MSVNYRYTIDFPLNNKSHNYIVKKLSSDFKKVDDCFVHSVHNYQLSFDYDMGFLKFDLNMKHFIIQTINRICDIVGANWGEYTIMDNELEEETSFEEIEAEEPVKEKPCYRYSVRLFPNNAKTIQQSIMIAIPNITIDSDEYQCEQFHILINGNESVCFYFNLQKLDIQYINSIIYPVMKTLGFQKFDYEVDDYRNDNSIPFEADFIAENGGEEYEEEDEFDDNEEEDEEEYEYDDNEDEFITVFKDRAKIIGKPSNIVFIEEEF